MDLDAITLPRDHRDLLFEVDQLVLAEEFDDFENW